MELTLLETNLTTWTAHFGLLGCLFAAYLAWLIVVKPRLYPSPYANLPGPPRLSWLKGTGTEGGKPKWLGIHDWTVMYRSRILLLPEVVGTTSIFVGDPRAVISAFDIARFGSSELRSRQIDFLVGPGIVSQYGQAHRRQRRTLAPAFTPAQIKGLSPIFQKFAAALANKIGETADVGGDTELRSWNSSLVDVATYLDCAALDVIGEAGFSYQFNALRDGQESNELAKSFKTSIEVAMQTGVSFILLMALSAIFYPPMGSWPVCERNRTIIRGQKVMDRIVGQIVDKKAAEIKQEMTMGAGLDDGQKDLLHLLMRQNMTTIKDSERLSRAEVAGQIQTFLFAGMETSAVSTSWALYELAHHQDVQDEIRDLILTNLDELRQHPDSDVGLPIDRILVESLRLHPPVVLNGREALEDTSLPLREPILTRDGKSSLSSIVVKKGSQVILGLHTVNMDESIYGSEPEKFRPSRWADFDEREKKATDLHLPSYKMFSFLGGNKGCIGSRFAMLEMRCFLIALLSEYRFEPSGLTINSRQALTVRPHVEETDRSGMPLRVIRLG